MRANKYSNQDISKHPQLPANRINH